MNQSELDEEKFIEHYNELIKVIKVSPLQEANLRIINAVDNVMMELEDDDKFNDINYGYYTDSNEISRRYVIISLSEYDR